MPRQFCGRTRREFLWEAGAGFGAVGLAALMGTDAGAQQTAHVNPLAPRRPHFAPKATSVIFLFMYGGPSHIETFDYKPQLYPLDGRTINVRTFGRGGRRHQGRAVRPQ